MCVYRFETEKLPRPFSGIWWGLFWIIQDRDKYDSRINKILGLPLAISPVSFFPVQKILNVGHWVIFLIFLLFFFEKEKKIIMKRTKDLKQKLFTILSGFGAATKAKKKKNWSPNILPRPLPLRLEFEKN